MQNRISRLFYGEGAYLSIRRMKEGEQLGRSAPDVFVRAMRRIAFFLPGAAWLRDRLVRAGFVFAPDGNAHLFG
jgi:hypothetical protein